MPLELRQLTSLASQMTSFRQRGKYSADNLVTADHSVHRWWKPCRSSDPRRATLLKFVMEYDGTCRLPRGFLVLSVGALMGACWLKNLENLAASDFCNRLISFIVASQGFQFLFQLSCCQGLTCRGWTPLNGDVTLGWAWGLCFRTA